MRRRRLLGIALLLLLLAGAGGVAAWRARRAAVPVGHTNTRSGEAPSPLGREAAREATVEASLSAIEDGERASARDRWDPAYVAELLGPDPAAHLDWVRTWTAWVPYRGVLRGPVGVLLDRQGNSLDRALLLADLLKRAGHEVRLAHGRLEAARAGALLPSLLRARATLVRSTTGRARPDWRDDLHLAAGAYLQDPIRAAHVLEARLDSAARMLDTLDARTDGQTARLRELLPKPDGRGGEVAGEDDPLTALQDHWWVQRLENGRWTDLDVLGLARGAGDLAADATHDPEALDSALYQRIVVRLVTERVSAGGGLTEQRGLQREVRPAAVIGQPVVLEIMPAGWQPGLIAAATDPAAAFRTAALEEREWQVTLNAAGQTAEASISLAGGAAATNSGNPFGGLGQGIGRALDQGSDELSAAWLEYEILVPDRPSRVIRRQLFDLVGPAARAAKRPVRLELDEERRLERSLALIRTTEILPLGSGIAPEFVLHLSAKAALANRNFLRASGPPPATSMSEAMETFLKAVVPGPSQLYTLAAMRISADPDADVFLDRPNVLSRHAFLALRRGRVVRLEGTDIVANEVGVVPGTSDPAGTRRRQGVRDTNAEALLYAGQPVLGSVADGFARSKEWHAITSPDDQLLAGLSADVRQRMVDDLAAGYVLVAPASLTRETPAELAVWWRTDPRTGQTLGVSGTGWGQTLAERVFQHAVLLASMVVEAWMFEFLWCTGAIGGGSGGAAASAGSPLDWLVTPAWADEEKSRSACVWEAWRSALLAGMFYKASVVWGILAKQIKLWRMLRALPPGEPAVPGGSPSAGGSPGGSPGGTPPAKPPPPDCPPGGGAPAGTAGEAPSGGGTRAPEEPGVNPLGKTQAADEPRVDPLGQTQAGETPGARPAEPGTEPPPRTEPAEPAPKSPAEERVPFDEAWGDMPPAEPGTYLQRSKGWAEKAPAAERFLGEEEAAARAAAAKAEEAKREIAAAEANPPAPDDYDAIQRLNDARMDVTMAERARQAVARAQAALDRIRALVDQYHRLEALNEALIQTRAEMREASARFEELVRSGKADFQGRDYARWKALFNQYQQALKEYAAAVRELGKVAPRPPSGGSGGGTVVMPERPVPPGSGPAEPAASGAGPQQCSAASPPAGSPPPGSPEAMSPPPGSPPPSPALDAQRRLAEAERALEAARAQRDAAFREMDAAGEKLFADEAAAAARGEEVPPQTPEYRALLRRKIDAIKRVWKLEEEYYLARFQAQQLEQANAAAGGAPPEIPVLVGLGGMSAP